MKRWSPAAPAAPGINTTLWCCWLHCAATRASSWEPVPWQEFPAERGLFWQCHLGPHWAAALAARWTSGKQPCASSASGCFLSHTCYETYSGTEIFMESWCQHQEEEEQVYCLVLQHSSLTELGTGSPAQPKQNRTISRQRYWETVLPLSP